MPVSFQNGSRHHLNAEDGCGKTACTLRWAILGHFVHCCFQQPDHESQARCFSLLGTHTLLKYDFWAFSLPMACAHRAALQLACDAPSLSIVSKHANQLPQRPCAKLLTKPDQWSPLMSTLKGHIDWVTSVAVAGDTIVSGSKDQTIRCG